MREYEGSDAFLAFSDVLQTSLKKCRDDVAAQEPEFLGPLFHAHTACIACIGSILSRPDRAFPVADIQQKLRRATIHSAVIQGLHLIEYSIATGCYVQASALVRQEIEAAEGLRGIRQGLQLDGHTPRLKALRHLGASYGELTGIAHLSTHDLLTRIVSHTIGSSDHTFNSAYARHIFGIHVCALVGVILDMAELRPFTNDSMLMDEEDWWLSAACGVLVEEGLMPIFDDI